MLWKNVSCYESYKHLVHIFKGTRLDKYKFKCFSKLEFSICFSFLKKTCFNRQEDIVPTYFLFFTVYACGCTCCRTESDKT